MGTEAIPTQLGITMEMAVLLGLHIGAQLLTRSKLNGCCQNGFGLRSNSNLYRRGHYSDAVLSSLESQNDAEVEGITAKVRMLKDVSNLDSWPRCKGNAVLGFVARVTDKTLLAHFCDWRRNPGYHTHRRS